MKFKLFLALIASALIFSLLSVGVFAYDENLAEKKADSLNTLGLFKGTDNGYELEKPLTRLEALIMLIRLNGNEFDVIYGEDFEHPFTDKPLWEEGNKYIAYGYNNNLTSGVSETLFAPNEPATLQMYATFVLRALGYTDSEEATVWDNWESLAKEAGILPEGISNENFLRGDVVLLSHAALDAKIYGSDYTLKQKLLESGIFSELSLSMANIAEGKEVTAESDLKDILGAVYYGVENIYVQGLMAIPMETDSVSFFIGADAEKIGFVEGIACEPMMSSKAHSVCLVRVEEGTDIEQAKKEIREKVDPRKWVCVSVSEGNIRVENIGNTIILVMDNEYPDELVNNFKNLDKTLIKPDEKGMLNVDGVYAQAEGNVNVSSVVEFVAKVFDLKDKYFAENKTYVATIPEKSYFMREKTTDFLNHNAIHLLLKQELFDINVIDVESALSLESYYLTDRHWRQEKLFPVMDILGDALGFSVKTDKYTAKEFDGYIGDYKEYVPEIPAEKLYILESEDITNTVVDNFQDKTYKKVYNEEKFASRIPYDIYLSGATPLMTLKNDGLENERKIVIFRDSYGSSIAPLFLENYSEVVLVDLRYMSSDLLSQYVDFTDAEVLFLLSDKVVNNSKLLK